MAGNWILAFLFLVSIAKAEVFYVTSLRYRGNSKGDITQAVANAWRDACASPWPAKVDSIQTMILYVRFNQSMNTEEGE
ncbi:hypothetical protein PS1_024584 [Malus domestica]